MVDLKAAFLLFRYRAEFRRSRLKNCGLMGLVL